MEEALSSAPYLFFCFRGHLFKHGGLLQKLTLSWGRLLVRTVIWQRALILSFTVMKQDQATNLLPFANKILSNFLVAYYEILWYYR